ncbi:MAG: hypothetical protein JW816_03015 [Candidatus Buchananbacteria bacterium]|nr:hypothetical protein [Candidatus Buchananbacteria bacterium]
MTREERQQEIAELKKTFFANIEKSTPQWIKDEPIFDLSNSGEIKFTLNKELIDKYQLDRWAADYEKEAKVSTSGVRGPQNVVYYWDTRFPINQLGVALATLAKTEVLKEQIKDRPINKIVSGEVRYNTNHYIDLISRIQAQQGINIHHPYNDAITTIWMTSFLIFMLDFDGGEYVTSSHAISSKTSTKDLDNQGSQFMPEMSLLFVEKIKSYLQQAKENSGGFTITLSARDVTSIVQDFDGFDLYVEYLRRGVGNDLNLNYIKQAAEKGMKIIFDAVGGCMNFNMKPIHERLGISDLYVWRNPDQDPFFHGIGKIWRVDEKSGQKEFFDLSCDSTLLPVAKTMGYEYDLAQSEIGQIVLITDPDGDRLVAGQVEPAEKARKLDDLGINYLQIDDKKIFSVYDPTFSFLMTADFYAKQLKAAGQWDKHSRVMITTAPSSKMWDEWAANQGAKVISCPVGFKEIANIIKKIEKQITANPEKEVVLTDIFGQDLNLGKDPRIIFAGEESGGMITGPEEFIVSKNGRKAIAMREKSAGEASVIMSAVAADLFLKKKSLSDYLEEIFAENNIVSRYYFRNDIVYYNESEPDPEKMRAEKLAGEVRRDKTDKFFLGLALSYRQKKISLDDVKKVLSEVFNDLDFSDLLDIIFVGESTQFRFTNMFVQVRRSGTDAKMRGYVGGADKARCLKYMEELFNYDGQLTQAYEELVPKEFYDNIYQLTDKLYKDYFYKDI